MDPITLGVVALIGIAATIGGASEDIESDIGSESNLTHKYNLPANGTFTQNGK